MLCLLYSIECKHYIATWLAAKRWNTALHTTNCGQFHQAQLKNPYFIGKKNNNERKKEHGIWMRDKWSAIVAGRRSIK